MKKILISCLLFFIYSSIISAQSFCKTPSVTNTEAYKILQESQRGITSTNYTFKLYFHVIRTSSGTGGVSTSNVQSAFNILNGDFNSHGIYFVWDGTIDCIDNSTYYNNADDYIFGIHNHTDGIDVYLFPSNTNSYFGLANGVGYSSELLIQGNVSGVPLCTTHVISHEMGHVLNLWHTHHGTFNNTSENGNDPNACSELVNGSNSTSCGDYVEDTPADPNLSGLVNSNCEYTGTARDVNNQLYQPDVNLIMSYTSPSCMTYFSTKQVERMKSSIANLSYLRKALYLTITGPSIISSSEIYSIANLPSGFTVSWSLSNSYYNSNCLQQNTPSANKCRITRSSSQDMSNATLTATIKYNGTEVRKLYKYHLYAHSGFKGTYFNGQATKTISLPTPLYFYPNKTNASISSPNLIDATISVSGTLASMPRSLDTTNGVLLFSTPNVSGSNTSVIHATCSNGDGYNLTIVTTTNTNLLNIIVGDGQMDVSLVPVVDDKLQEIDLVTKLKTPSFDTAANDFQTWTLEVYTATTGEKVFSQTVEGSSFTIDTTGWKPSVYVVRAVIGDEVLNEKVVVN